MKPELHPAGPGRDEARIAPDIVAQAATWLVRLIDTPTPQLEQACLNWRQAHPDHELAWQRLHGLQSDLRQGAAGLDAGAAQTALRARHQQRRTRRRMLAGLLALGGTGWLAWQARDTALVLAWRADYHTDAGEQRSLQLADGTRLMLNTRTAVDIDFAQNERLIRLLAGEILVDTGADAVGRPMRVATAFGDLYPHGTRFTVRMLETGDRAVMAVQQGAVLVEPSQAREQARLIPEGEQVLFDATDVSAMPEGEAWLAGDAWSSGVLLANRMRLDAFVAELARYRPGLLRCAPQAAHYRVSGAFPVRDTDAALDMLADIVPVRIQRRTRYWVTVQPRG